MISSVNEGQAIKHIARPLAVASPLRIHPGPSSPGRRFSFLSSTSSSDYRDQR